MNKCSGGFETKNKLYSFKFILSFLIGIYKTKGISFTRKKRLKTRNVAKLTIN